MNILDAIKERRLFCDGGTGTYLQARGLKPGEPPDLWNLSRPQDIIGMHKAYLFAGSDIIASNTFSANPLRFENYEEIIAAAIKNARTAIKEAGKKEGEAFVVLDIGPSGRMLEPLGDFPFEEAVETFAKIVKAAVPYSPDAILIETMNDSLETKAAVLAAKENSSLPVFVTNVYDENGTLMTGASPEAMVAMLEGLDVDALGMNCSLGPKQMIPLVERIMKITSTPVIVNPNAGLPRTEDGNTVYDVGEDEFASCMKEMALLGVNIMGGCCGTTPEYIKKEREAVSDVPYSLPTKKDITMVSSFTHAVFFGERTILIGERINPTGKKRFKQALLDHDINYILEEGLSQQKAGADILDVNVGLPEIDEPSMMKEVVSELQAVSDLPLQIDTGDEKALESALRIYNGKPMINSVNGRKDIQDKVFPLAKKYGGLIVGLTIGEAGVPETVEERVEIARKIYERAAEYGIEKKNIIIDPLAMAVSANDDSGLVTLEAVRRIHDELQGLTSLGVSNISFGLPERSTLNSAFLLMTMTAGLSAAIMNPFSADMMRAFLSFNVLSGKDKNCAAFLEKIGDYEIETHEKKTATDGKGLLAKEEPKDADPLSSLSGAIEKGLKERAADIAKDLIKDGTDPLLIVNEAVIPALNHVGEGFEKKKLFLPNLLMASEAAQAAFSVIKENMQGKDGGLDEGGKIVIATVKGDVHDIGKNIVKVILENYGFSVTDLGKDVPPERVVSAVKETGARLVGLSALMTTTVPAMEETIKKLHEETPGVKIMVGGAVMNEEYAAMIKADFYGRDAMASVRYAEEVLR